MKFKIKYGLGGGYNLKEEEIVECDSLEDAEQWAYEMACQEYESYGVFDYSEYEDSDYTDEEIDQEYQQDLESWIIYSAEEVS